MTLWDIGTTPNNDTVEVLIIQTYDPTRKSSLLTMSDGKISLNEEALGIRGSVRG